VLEVKVVGRGVDTLVLNVCYADKQFQPIKQELNSDLQDELNMLQGEARINESQVVTEWAFKGFNLFMKEKRSRGQWRWILTCPLVTLAISRGRLNPMIAQVRLSSEYLWSCETVSDAIVEVSLLLYDLFGEYLCADSIGWDVASTNWQEHFVSRAVVRTGGLLMFPLMGRTWRGRVGSAFLLILSFRGPASWRLNHIMRQKRS
jgi:hypothetical protein